MPTRIETNGVHPELGSSSHAVVHGGRNPGWRPEVEAVATLP